MPIRSSLGPISGAGARTRLGRALASLVFSLGAALLFAPGCGSSGTSGNGNGSGTGGDGGFADLFGDGGSKGPCKGLECAVATCAGTPTTVTGTVYAPNGTLPLYNVVVYVPNAPLDDIPEGPSCDRCGNVSGSPVTSTLTDTKGHFELKNVPVGSDIPLVIQVGKWRRVVKLPKIEKCVENPVDKALTRLPKNQSEGHIPKMAVTTGHCDHLACLLPKLGLDASETDPKSPTARLKIFKGTDDDQPAPAPSGSPDATTLWGDLTSLKPYDMVILSCECGEHDESKPDAAKRALYEYAKLGGRVFASHYHYTWFQHSPFPELKNLAEWSGDGNAPGGEEEPFLVDQSFPKGAALAEWLVNVAATTKLGEIPINQARSDVVGVTKSTTTRWVYNKPFGMSETTKYLSFNAPVDQPVENQCGKVVFGDMHISGADTTTLPDDGFPGSCPKELTPEEKALIFLFFDLSSCVQKDDAPPVPPVK